MNLTFDNIKSILTDSSRSSYCEIEFCISEIKEYQLCWMGKMPDRENPDKDCYWYGLVPNGSQAYDYDNFDDFSNAPIFNGESLIEIWDKIELLSFNSCSPNRETLEDMGYTL